MKNKQRALVLAVLFVTAIFIVNSYADHGTATRKTIVCFAGVHTTEFSKAKELGAATVQVNTLSASELQSALEIAKSQGLDLFGRAESRRQFQTETYNINFVKLKNITADVFSETEIASDPDFLGYYII